MDSYPKQYSCSNYEVCGNKLPEPMPLGKGFNYCPQCIEAQKHQAELERKAAEYDKVVEERDRMRLAFKTAPFKEYSCGVWQIDDEAFDELCAAFEEVADG